MNGPLGEDILKVCLSSSLSTVPATDAREASIVFEEQALLLSVAEGICQDK